MRRIPRFFAVLLLVAGALGAATLFTSANQSVWTVAQGGNTIGKLTMTTDGTNVRVEWKPSSGAATTFVSTGGKLWMKGTAGDEEFSKYKDAVGRAIVPAFLLPVTTAANDRLTASGAKVSNYSYASSAAAYTYDAKGAQKVEITAGATKYVATRDSLSAGSGSMATFYEVKPKTSRLAGLKGMGAGLLGPSDNSVSASAGVKGMDPETAMKEGIDLAKVDELIARDAKPIDASLKKFQKEGKVGGAQ